MSDLKNIVIFIHGPCIFGSIYFIVVKKMFRQPNLVICWKNADDAASDNAATGITVKYIWRAKFLSIVVFRNEILPVCQLVNLEKYLKVEVIFISVFRNSEITITSTCSNMKCRFSCQAARISFRKSSNIKQNNNYRKNQKNNKIKKIRPSVVKETNITTINKKFFSKWTITFPHYWYWIFYQFMFCNTHLHIPQHW